ncbi:MAG: CBS domain-containing protein, partial [Candidatus Saccharibacteria bacterium]
MDIITSHNSLDFDGLASMVAAGKLYPSAVKILSGSLSQNVRQFMGLYKHSLEIRTANEVEIKDLENIIIVDTRSRNRLGRLRDVDGHRFIVFDHHPDSPDDVKGSTEYIEPVGATTTILVELIKEKGLPVSPFEATILALGIYEDTGSLLFSSTTPRDAAAVAFLLSNGANLGVVNNFIERPFSSEQRQVMQNLLATMRHCDIHGLNVAIASCSEEDFIPGLSTVVHRLAEVESCDALIVVAAMQGRINIVARSRTPNIEVNRLLEAFGGQGHEKAAAAVVKSTDIQMIINGLLQGLQEKAKPGLLARDIMSTPVKSVAIDLSMEEAGKTMLRYGHTGMPVVEGERMVGVISRRDVDKAR